MSGTGSPAHRAPVQRNRLIAVGAGLALFVILLFALLAYCTSPDDPPSTTADPGPSTGTSWTISPGPGAPGGGEAAPLPSGSAPLPSGSAPADDVATRDPTAEPSGDDPDQSSTPEGGVDAGGGSLVDGRRLALLVTGGFLMMSAVVAGAYSLRRPPRRP